MTPELREGLRSIERFQREGDARSAAAGRRQMIEARLVERLQDGPGAIRQEDAYLLISCAADLQRDEEHEIALDLLSAARSFADHVGARVWSRRASLLAVRSCVSLVDLDTGARVLRGCLDLPETAPLNEGAAIEAAAGLRIATAAPQDLAPLRAEALCELARYLAASGALLAADAVFARLLAAPPTRMSWISLEDVAILAAEGRLDRGDFAGFESLRQQWDERQGAARPTWLLLEGQAFHLQGNFSKARDCFARLVFESPSATAGDVQMGRWHLTQVLATLNYVGEAQSVLDDLAREGGDGFDVRAMAAHLAARWHGSATAFEPLAAPREMAALPFIDDNRARRREHTAAAGSSDPRALYRRSERVRDDWSRMARAVELAVERSDFRRAGSRLLALSTWMPRIESPLLQARFLRLAALVAYARKELAESEQLAADARERFDRLAMSADAWDASSLRVGALRAAGAPAPAIEAESDRASALLQRVTDRLDPMDRSLYLLNKWSTVDIQMEARLARMDVAGPARRMRRAARLTLKDIAALRQWDAPSRRAGGTRGDEPAPPQGTDVFAWVRSQAYAQRGRRRRWGEVMPLHPWLIARDTALLHYLVLPTTVEAVLMHAAGCTRLTIARKADRATLHETTARALTLLADQRGGPWSADLQPLASLAEMLGFPELDQSLPPRVRRLIVVLDDVIVHVPFAALPFRGVPLVRELVPCVTPYARWAERSARRPHRFSRAIGVGVRRPPYVLAGPRGRSEYPMLADPAPEFEALAAATANPQPPLCDDDATVQRVLAALESAEVAHFVCHGDFFAGRPNPSKLLLWDGPLEVPHIQAADLARLRLVVMGACWAAGTRVLPGREMVGMPTAFLERGADAALASLWALPDAGTARFMQELFSELGGADPAQAVATVQRRWAESRPTHEWAGYQMYVAGLPPRPLGALALAVARRIRP